MTELIEDNALALDASRIIGSDAAVAVGRFDPNGVHGYRARSLPDGPLRATRAEAEADERQRAS